MEIMLRSGLKCSRLRPELFRSVQTNTEEYSFAFVKTVMQSMVY